MNSLNYGELFDKSWKSINKNLLLSAGITIVYFLAISVFSVIPFAGGILTSLMLPGYLKCLLRIKDQQNFEFTDLFWSFLNLNRLINYILLSILMSLSIGLGFILLVIPGIFMLVSLSLANAYFIFREEDAMAAFKNSFVLVKKNRWFMFGLLILIGMLNILGAACLLIGLLVTIPMSILLMYYSLEAYEHYQPEVAQATVVKL